MPNPELLCRALAAVDPLVCSLDEFQAITGIQSRSVARGVVEFLAGNGVGAISRSKIEFSAADRMNAAMLCLHHGCDIQIVSEQISWKDFELMASEVLKSYGYQTQTNVRFVKPRMEIDVVGVRGSLAVAIDCKHWSHTNLSSILNYSRKQAARAVRLVNKQSKVATVVPVILTLRTESVKFVERIPVVPVSQLRSFIEDLHAYIPEMHVVTRA